MCSRIQPYHIWFSLTNLYSSLVHHQRASKCKVLWNVYLWNWSDPGRIFRDWGRILDHCAVPLSRSGLWCPSQWRNQFQVACNPGCIACWGLELPDIFATFLKEVYVEYKLIFYRCQYKFVSSLLNEIDVFNKSLNIHHSYLIFDKFVPFTLTITFFHFFHS